jgi:hypothetical protein
LISPFVTDGLSKVEVAARHDGRDIAGHHFSAFQRFDT